MKIPEQAAEAAWTYELASHKEADSSYSAWNWHVSFSKPNVPAGAIRNLKPLYTAALPLMGVERPKEPQITFPRWWIDDLYKKMMTVDVFPTGREGDFLFQLRDHIGNALASQPAALPAQSGSGVREDVARAIGDRDLDVLRTRLKDGCYNTVGEDDLILPSDLARLFNEIDRLRALPRTGPQPRDAEK